jgi:hypothetical protein
VRGDAADISEKKISEKKRESDKQKENHGDGPGGARGDIV